MENIDCSYEAHKKLVESGVHDKILEKRDLINSFLINRSLYAKDSSGEILERAKRIYLNPNGGIDNKYAAARDILALDEKLDKEILRGDDGLFFQHPSFLSQVVLGEDMNYKTRGFSSLRSLYDSIASFCLGNREELQGHNDFQMWRNKNVKSKIDLNTHGDFFVYQSDISSRLEKTLFGDEVEIAKIDATGSGISSNKDSSDFLLSVLKYAGHVGMGDIPEIKDWRGTLEEVGSHGTATAESFGGGRLDDDFFDKELSTEGKQGEWNSIVIYSSGGVCTYPIVGKDGNLYFNRYKHGEISSIDCGRRLKFTPEDITDLLKGTYKLFTRDKSLLPKIMEKFE